MKKPWRYHGQNPRGLRPLGFWPWDLPRHNIHHDTSSAFSNNIPMYSVQRKVNRTLPAKHPIFKPSIENFQDNILQKTYFFGKRIFKYKFKNCTIRIAVLKCYVFFAHPPYQNCYSEWELPVGCSVSMSYRKSIA